MGPTDAFTRRWLDELRRLGVVREGARVLVAVSGGCDSISLLHLFRFTRPETGLDLAAAHFDHAMRPESGGDALWVRGVCRAWGVPLRVGRADEALRSESEARSSRYAFLHRVAREERADFIATGHHADDQAETILFRVLRGTGLRGLRGIPQMDERGLFRPLLPFWRVEIERYARGKKLRWRTDPTNALPVATRNRIRQRLLPLIEKEVAPGARHNLVRLGQVVQEADQALDEAARPLREAAVRFDEGAYLLARPQFRKYDSELGSRVLRDLLRRFGVVLDRRGTRSALQFISDAPSGSEMPLRADVRLVAEYDEVRLERSREVPPDAPARITSPSPASTVPAVLGGEERTVSWRSGVWTGGVSGVSVALRASSLYFPLELRTWQPGDRIRTAGGTKTLKKLFGERRIPRAERHQRPVLVDASGAVLWVSGVLVTPDATPRPGEAALFLSIS